MNAQGFTYVELVMSLGVISILTCAALPSMERMIETRRALEVVEKAKILNLAVADMFRLHGITNDTFAYCGIGRFEELESMLAGGYDAFDVGGYWLAVEQLDLCRMYIEYFKGIEPFELYEKL